MLYSSAGLLALIIHLIINYDVLSSSKGNVIPAHRTYRAFLVTVMFYYVTDICWGLLYEHHLIALTIFDTQLYFLAMALSILMWTRFAVEYLQNDDIAGKMLKSFGWAFLGFAVVILIINFFNPILFEITDDGVYHAEWGRYITLVLQVVMFLMASVYSLTTSFRTEGTMKTRHHTISFSSLAMAGMIVAQAFFPLLPLYAIGCLLTCCLLHSFVLESEKEEYRGVLEQRLEDNISKGNYYDLLTDLPGMTYFFELAEKDRKEMLRAGEMPAFLFMDLSGMKFYNQKHGFAGGDQLLQKFADLLKPAFGEENCSRFGQDHFVVITGETNLEQRLKQLLEKWESLDIEDRPAVRVGVYQDRTRCVNISIACDRAKAARDSIRNTFISSIQYYDAAMLEDAERKVYIISHLDQAIEERWIKVYYHPIIRAANGLVCNEESLARWIDPERGFLTPAEFIPILEDAGLLYKLDLCVVDQVLEKLQQLQESGLFLVPQSVNLSRADFDACDIVEEIRTRVDRAGIPRNLLAIEITESIVGSDVDFMKEQIDRFRALGFPVWMDDFGSGYSSLDLLSKIDVDLIKLDMHFLDDFDQDDRRRVILKQMVKMLIGLGFDTLCEGVERKEQVDFLCNIGCARLQGFYYSKPIPLEEILDQYEKEDPIGFEDPAETDYFDTIAKIDLQNMEFMAREDRHLFRHSYSTMPMAILEVRGERARFTRSNTDYREFMKRVFHFSMDARGRTFEEVTEEEGKPFVYMLRKCCEEGGRAEFHDHLPNGITVHSFMMRIAENPLTGTTAAAVAVLGVTDDEGMKA